MLHVTPRPPPHYVLPKTLNFDITFSFHSRCMLCFMGLFPRKIQKMNEHMYLSILYALIILPILQNFNTQKESECLLTYQYQWHVVATVKRLKPRQDLRLGVRYNDLIVTIESPHRKCHCSSNYNQPPYPIITASFKGCVCQWC